MSSSRFRPELYRVLIHPLLSISIASTGVLAAIWLGVVNFGVVAPRTGTIIVVILAPVIEAIAGNILYRERAGIANRIRELLIYLVLLYAIFSILRTGPLGTRFVPGLEQILPIVATTIAWLLAFAFHERLRGRESLLRAFHGKHGAELRRAVLDRQHDMALTVGQLRKSRTVIGGVFAFLVFLTVFASIDPFGVSTLRAGSGAFIVLVLYGTASIAAIGSLNTFVEEYAANGEGIAVPTRFQRRRSVLAAVIIGIVLVLGFALSRRQGLLPLEAIAAFFRWLGSLFDNHRNAGLDQSMFQQPAQNPVSPDMLEMLQEMDAREPPLWLRLLVRLIGRVLVAVAIVGAAVLLFGPLFSPGFRKVLLGLHPGKFLRELVANLRRRFAIVMKLIRAGLRRRRGHAAQETVVAAADESWRESQWKPGLRKRRQMSHVVQVFVEIAQWGGKHGAGYSRSEAAHEYLRRIIALVPERYPDAMLVADIFCEARFSRHLVPPSRMREYVRAAHRITRSQLG